MPSTGVVGGPLGSTRSAAVVNAACTIGQDRRWSRPDWVTVRPPSQTASPAACRSRHVTRARAGSCGTVSVNEVAGQSEHRQYQRRLCQISWQARPPTSRSRGLVAT
jgi:hypothetical protein